MTVVVSYKLQVPCSDIKYTAW